MRPFALGSSIAFAVLLARAAVADLSFVTRTDFPTGPGPTAMTVGRVNEDRFADLVVTDDHGFSVLFGSGRGTFSTPLAVRGQPRPDCVAVGDFDGDGRLDVAWASGIEPQVRVQRGDGMGGFGTPQHLRTGPHPYTIWAIDVNNDRHTDLIVGHGTIASPEAP